MAAQNRLDETFDLLAHPHRRYVLHHLSNKSEVVDIDTLAVAIAKRDGGHPAAGCRDNSDTIEIGLRHAHLPKLVDAGIITFDADTDSIEHVETNGHGQFIAEAARIDGYTDPAAGD